MKRGGGWSEGGGVVEGEGRSVWVWKKAVFDTSSGEHGMAAPNGTQLYYNNSKVNGGNFGHGVLHRPRNYSL